MLYQVFVDRPDCANAHEPLRCADARAFRSVAVPAARSTSGLAPETVRTYRRRLDVFLTWWQTFRSEHPLDARLAKDFMAWVCGTRESPTGRPPRPFSPLSCNMLLSAVRRWCAALVEIGRLPCNPFDALPGLPCPPRIRHRLLSSKEIRRILDGFRCDTIVECRDYAIVLLLLHGARETELIRATIGDLVDLGPEGGYELLVWSKGKHRQESIVLTPHVRRAVDRYLSLRFPEERPADAPLFAAHHGSLATQPLSARALRKQVRQAVVRAGLPGQRISSLAFRFSGGAQAYLRGAPARSVQRLLRHESVRRTRVLLEQVDRIRFGAERYLDHLIPR